MSSKNTRRNKCMRCGEHYKSFHLCKKPIELKWSIQQNSDAWGGIEVSGVEYARQETTDDFDKWFAPIEKYIEERLG